MRSVQEREQSSDASESGFFEKGHGPSPALANEMLARHLAPDGVAAEEAASLEPLAQSATVQDAAVQDAAVDDAAVDDAVLHAFGEVRSLNAELQRANDALHGVNEALRGKMDQLRTTTLDLEQMLDGVELGVLLLDEELAVRHFNDMAAHFLGLGSHDVGGSISASCRGFGPRLVEWCQEVLRTGRRLRRTFQSAIGEPLTLHVRRSRVDGESRLILVFTETA